MAKAAVVSRSQQLDLNYDPEGDVLYVNFGAPQAADDSDITDEGIVLHLKNEKLVGLTILNAKERLYSMSFLKAHRVKKQSEASKKSSARATRPTSFSPASPLLRLYLRVVPPSPSES